MLKELRNICWHFFSPCGVVIKLYMFLMPRSTHFYSPIQLTCSVAWLIQQKYALVCKLLHRNQNRKQNIAYQFINSSSPGQMWLKSRKATIILKASITICRSKTIISATPGSSQKNFIWCQYNSGVKIWHNYSHFSPQLIDPNISGSGHVKHII